MRAASGSKPTGASGNGGRALGITIGDPLALAGGGREGGREGLMRIADVVWPLRAAAGSFASSLRPLGIIYSGFTCCLCARPRSSRAPTFYSA